jgi:hypothetical protein
VIDLTISGCNFVGAGPGAAAASTNEAILLGAGATRVHIQNNNFSNLAYWAVRAQQCTDCWVENNEVLNSWGGLVLWQGGAHHHTLRNIVHDPPNNLTFTAPIQIDSSTNGCSGGCGNSTDDEVSLNHVYNLVFGEAFTDHSFNHLTMTGNVMDNVDFCMGFGGTASGDVTTDFTVTGNVCNPTSTNASQGATNTYGINVSGGVGFPVTHGTLQGNVINNANVINNTDIGGGIGVNNADDINVLGNIIRNSHGNGIALGSPLTRVSVRGNRISDLVNSVGGGNRGIYVIPTSSGITGLIEANQIDNVKVGIQSDASNTSLLLGSNNITNFTGAAAIVNGGNFGVYTQNTLTVKKGSGAGNYTNATTAYIAADATNLCYSILIPTGWKLGVSASGGLSTATAAVVAQAAVTDTASCGTANSGILIETPPIQGAAIGVADTFALDWVIAGDGNIHSVALQFKTSNVADTASLINSSATVTPTMKFELMPSN